MRSPCSLFIVLLAISASSLMAADPPAKDAKHEHECRFASGPIKIDGVADEAAWKEAAPIDNWGLPWLKDKARPPRTGTKSRCLWDREYFYFFAEMEDSDLYADVKEHDGQTWDNDVFEIFFKPAEEKPGYYELQVNAAGTLMDCFFPRRGAGGFNRFKKDGDFHIEAKVKLDGTLNKWQDKDKSWSVEGRIPWTDFLRTGGRPAPDEAWRFAFCRYDYSVDFEGPDLSTCAPLSSKGYPDFHSFEDYATLKFVGPPAKRMAEKLGWKEAPKLTTSKVVGSPDPPAPYRVKKAFPKLKLNYPIQLVRQPGSDLMLGIVQDFSYSPTTLIRFRDSPDVDSYETVAKFTDERLFYDICFHPKFAENGFVYLGTNVKVNGVKHSRVSRFVVDREAPFKFQADSETVILEWPSDGHNGAAITFGLDGMMYVTSGDGTSDSDTNVTGQDLTKLLAKVLRIDVDRPANGKPYSVPADNPFLKMKEARPETWAMGLRNPWRITTDAKTGHIWVGNNGQDLWEQVYFIRKGENYGWSVVEGSHPFYPTRTAAPLPFAKPAAEHSHSEARSLTGGVVYYGEKLPELRGAYIYGDHSTGKIWAMKHDGEKVVWHKELCDLPFHITCFSIDKQGELLVADHQGGGNGNFYYLEPNEVKGSATKFPQRLRETGLYRNLLLNQMAEGMIPYSVNSPLWSDGAMKERWLGIPHKEGEDRRIDFTTWRGWNFPDESLLVKTFSLPRESESSKPPRRIETRILVKQQGEWVGYTYLWNDAQTDAELVPAAGLDKEFEVGLPGGGAGKQTWHYPSRTECMVCHSRAANYVLGLSELQMNKDHIYQDGVSANQLEVLEQLGMLKVNYHGDTTTRLRTKLEKKGLEKKAIDEQVDAATSSRDQRGAKPTQLLAHDPAGYRKLANPYDEKESLEERARSYLHANCSICHVEAGGGNAKMELEYTTLREKMNLIGEKPVHHTFGIDDARLVAPGHPERSVLLHRVSTRKPGAMPQLGTNLVDEDAVKMLKEWIKEMKTP